MRILVVEDRRKIAQFIQKGLNERGFVVDLAQDGDSGYQLAESGNHDAIILDLMLPGMDGLTILRQLRESGKEVPVLILTAKSEVNERVEGLELGADDYLTKPFYVEELVARLNTILRRGTPAPPPVTTFGDLSVNMATLEVKRGEELIELTTREFSLLRYLTRTPGRVYTRTQICQHVWDYDFDPESNIVDVYIRKLRQKIDTDPNDKLIETVRGVGYRIRCA